MENEVQVQPQPQSQSLQTNEIWKRGLLMLLFALAFAAAQMVLNAVTVIQFIWLLAKRERNGQLAVFGKSLGLWLSEAAAFMSGATDDKPFPWRAWP